MTTESAATMSVVDQITEGIESLIGSPTKGQRLSSTRTAILSMILEKIEDGKLGLKALINKFCDNGMANQVDSWRFSKKNEVISAAQIEKAFGREAIEEMAQEAGLPASEVEHELAIVIPVVIDQFTPGGKIPEPACVQQAASLLRTKLVM